MSRVFIFYGELTKIESHELEASIKGLGRIGQIDRCEYVDPTRNDRTWEKALKKSDLVFCLRPTSRQEELAAQRLWNYCRPNQRISVLFDSSSTERTSRRFFIYGDFWGKRTKSSRFEFPTRTICISGPDCWPLRVVKELHEKWSIPLNPWEGCVEPLNSLGQLKRFQILRDEYILPLTTHLITDINGLRLNDWVQELESLVHPLVQEIAKILITLPKREQNQITALLVPTPLNVLLVRAKTMLMARTEQTQEYASIAAAVGAKSSHAQQQDASESDMGAVGYTQGETAGVAMGTTDQGLRDMAIASAARAMQICMNPLQSHRSRPVVYDRYYSLWAPPMGAGCYAQILTSSGGARGVYFQSNTPITVAVAIDPAQRGVVAVRPGFQR